MTVDSAGEATGGTVVTSYGTGGPITGGSLSINSAGQVSGSISAMGGTGSFPRPPARSTPG